MLQPFCQKSQVCVWDWGGNESRYLVLRLSWDSPVVCVSVCVMQVCLFLHESRRYWLPLAGLKLLVAHRRWWRARAGENEEEGGRGGPGSVSVGSPLAGWKLNCLSTHPSSSRKPGVFSGLSCQSFLKQLCSKAYAGLTSEGNFLFGEVEAKEFPVWADRASWLEGFLEGKQFHNEMTN